MSSVLNVYKTLLLGKIKIRGQLWRELFLISTVV